MILFCEDCGAKNDLPAGAYAYGRAVFRCSACGYANAYAVPDVHRPLKPASDGAAAFLEQIRAHPGVIGAFFYHTEKGITGSRMPRPLTLEDIETLGRELACAYIHGARTCPDLTQMSVVMSDKHFFVHQVAGFLFLVVAAKTPFLPEKVLLAVKGLDKR